jgi:RHS repeat-associated protein
MNHLTNEVHYNGASQILAQYQYTVASDGTRLASVETRRESGGNYSTTLIAWTNDALHRLTREASSSTVTALNFTNSYVYDLAGNRLWRTNGATGEVITYSYNTNDQLLVESSTLSGSVTNKYDVNGSLTNRASASESATYVYNLQNRLAGAIINRVESGHTVAITACYTNNYAGLRVRSVASESVDGGGATIQTKVFLFDTKSGNGKVLEELSAVGGWPTVSYTIGSKVLSQSKSGVVSHLLGDGHGSTRLLTGSTGAVTDRYSYDAYGKTLGFNPGVVNQPTTAALYSGEYLDRDLQQYNLQARFYNPSTGRFSAIDPFSPNQLSGANLYAYCGNDPINNSDPSGMYEIDVHQFLTRFLAEKAGFGAQAETIGFQTQQLDAPGDSRSAMINDLPNHYNMEAYHFVSQHRLSELWSSAYFWGKPNGKFFEWSGEYFHALEDTYAHCTGVGDRNWDYYGSVTGLGHGPLGHEPDHTWRDAAKGMKMAEEVYSKLIDFSIVNGSYTPTCPDWSSIAPQVEKFMSFQPNVYKEPHTYYGQTIYVENATFDGYTAKIHQLDTGYNIDQIYADKGVYLKVNGQRPSKTVFGATVGATVGVRAVPTMIGIGIGWSLGLPF